jgi:hypothetical protein
VGEWSGQYRETVAEEYTNIRKRRKEKIEKTS